MSGLALDTAMRNMEAGANFIGLSAADQAAMRTPEQRHEMELDISGTAAERVLQTDRLMAFIAIQPRKFGIPRGGLTYAPYVDMESVESNSVLMRPKNSGDPDESKRFDAGKAGIRGPAAMLKFLRSADVSRGDKLEVIHDVMFRFVDSGLQEGAFDERLGPRDYTFAPDGGTNGYWMAEAVNAAEKLTDKWLPALATAKPYGLDPLTESAYRKGGIEGRAESTGRGVVEAMRLGIEANPQLMAKIEKGEPITVGLDGYGGVGSWVHQTLAEDFQDDPILSKVVVAGISDETGTYVDPKGVKVMNFKTLRGLEASEGAVPTLEFACPERPVSKSSNDLLTGDFDVLIVASMANRIATAEDVQEYPDETRFSVRPEDIKAEYIVEAGNNSVTYRAQSVLHRMKVVIDTGIYANSQGANLSFEEYQYGKALMVDPDTPPPSLEVSRQDLAASIARRNEAITEVAKREKIDRVLAAYVVSAINLSS